MQLRNYQKKALDKATCWFDKEITNPLIVLPTGGGKTVVFATLIKQLYQEDCSRRFLTLAHRQELIQQAKDKLLAVWPEAGRHPRCQLERIQPNGLDHHRKPRHHLVTQAIGKVTPR